MATYTVRRGDSLSRIAWSHGFRSWQEIYNHPSNAGFKRLRPNPNLIFPGDIINIPGAAAGGGSPPPPPPAPGPRIDPNIGAPGCCYLAANAECRYIGHKSLYFCRTELGFYRQAWNCWEGTREFWCGECVYWDDSYSLNCKAAKRKDCAIWWEVPHLGRR